MADEDRNHPSRSYKPFTVGMSHTQREFSPWEWLMGKWSGDKKAGEITRTSTYVIDNQIAYREPTSFSITYGVDGTERYELECPVEYHSQKGMVFDSHPYADGTLRNLYGKKLPHLAELAKVEASKLATVGVSPGTEPDTHVIHHFVKDAGLANDIRHGLTEACKTIKEKLKPRAY
jgi:hypothetical protein